MVLSAARINAQQYRVDWSKIAGGGGTCTGGVFTATGTIDQPDAGALSGGGFTVQDGFWGIIAAVQTTNAPFLQIALSAANSVVISWPSPSAGWSLLHNSTLDNTDWVTPLTP